MCTICIHLHSHPQASKSRLARPFWYRAPMSAPHVHVYMYIKCIHLHSHPQVSKEAIVRPLVYLACMSAPHRALLAKQQKKILMHVCICIHVHTHTHANKYIYTPIFTPAGQQGRIRKAVYVWCPHVGSSPICIHATTVQTPAGQQRRTSTAVFVSYLHVSSSYCICITYIYNTYTFIPTRRPAKKD